MIEVQSTDLHDGCWIDWTGAIWMNETHLPFLYLKGNRSCFKLLICLAMPDSLNTGSSFEEDEIFVKLFE
jgi:hypothetical protein